MWKVVTRLPVLLAKMKTTSNPVHMSLISWENKKKLENIQSLYTHTNTHTQIHTHTHTHTHMASKSIFKFVQFHYWQQHGNQHHWRFLYFMCYWCWCFYFVFHVENTTIFPTWTFFLPLLFFLLLCLKFRYNGNILLLFWLYLFGRWKKYKFIYFIRSEIVHKALWWIVVKEIKGKSKHWRKRKMENWSFSKVNRRVG